MSIPPDPPSRIVVLGGGFAGVAVVRHLERLGRGRVEMTLVNRDNFFVLTPLLFEACSGMLELRHCSQPIRPALRETRFIEGTVGGVDVDRREVHVLAGERPAHVLPFDHLVVTLGAATDQMRIAGAENAFTFKTPGDAIALRNHVIERFERADVTSEPLRRQRCLTFVVVGGGLVGVELLGELTAFAEDILRYYPNVGRRELRFHLFELGPRILPEIDPRLAQTAVRVLTQRGVEISPSTPVESIDRTSVHLAGRTIEADTIVLAAGIVPSPAAVQVPVEHDSRGRILVDSTMRSRSHPQVWALGDCALIPGPDGRPFPARSPSTRSARRGRWPGT